jgi:hypothetical protein
MLLGPDVAEETKVGKRITEKNIYKERAIESCGFCNRTCWALRRNNITDVFALIHIYNKGTLGSIKGIGEKGYSEIEKYISEEYLDSQEY